MMDRLDGIERDYAELEASLGDPDIVGDQNKLRDASRLYKQMTPIVQCIRTIRETQGNAEAAHKHALADLNYPFADDFDAVHRTVATRRRVDA
jgi:peptide chain release factor 1